MGFNINEKTNGKNLIEEILFESKSFMTFTRSGLVKFLTFKNKYAFEDINTTINENDIYNYALTRTKREEVCTSIKCKYEYNVMNDEYSSQYPDNVYASDVLSIEDLIEDYNGYEDMNLNKPDTLKELELKYHYDYNTVENFAKYYLYNYCNQHNIVNLELPLKYANLEVGDIIKLPLIKNNKFYGEDYTTMQYRNGQWIYPLWFITDISIDTKKIKLSAYQLHYLGNDNDHSYSEPEISYCYFGDTGNLEVQDAESCELQGGTVLSDSDIVFYGSAQEHHSTITATNGNPTPNLLYDANALYDNKRELGIYDLMQNGTLNIADVIALINIIIGDVQPTNKQIEQLTSYKIEDGETANDEEINVADIVSLTNKILL